jgi:hypothetical protein
MLSGVGTPSLTWHTPGRDLARSLMGRHTTSGGGRTAHSRRGGHTASGAGTQSPGAGTASGADTPLPEPAHSPRRGHTPSGPGTPPPDAAHSFRSSPTDSGRGTPVRTRVPRRDAACGRDKVCATRRCRGSVVRLPDLASRTFRGSRTCQEMRVNHARCATSNRICAQPRKACGNHGTCARSTDGTCTTTTERARKPPPAHENHGTCAAPAGAHRRPPAPTEDARESPEVRGNHSRRPATTASAREPWHVRGGGSTGLLVHRQSRRHMSYDSCAGSVHRVSGPGPVCRVTVACRWRGGGATCGRTLHAHRLTNTPASCESWTYRRNYVSCRTPRAPLAHRFYQRPRAPRARSRGRTGRARSQIEGFAERFSAIGPTGRSVDIFPRSFTPRRRRAPGPAPPVPRRRW